MELVEFLRARLDEDEQAARAPYDEAGDYRIVGSEATELHFVRWKPDRVLAEVEAKRRILELHESWPVLVETEPEFSTDTTDLHAMSMAVSKRMAWLTTQEYRARFGDEPPTSPILRLLALPYADHPDYDENWRP